MDQEVLPAHKAYREPEGPWVCRDRKVSLDLQVPRALPVKPVLLVPRVLRV